MGKFVFLIILVIANSFIVTSANSDDLVTVNVIGLPDIVYQDEYYLINYTKEWKQLGVAVSTSITVTNEKNKTFSLNDLIRFNSTFGMIELNTSSNYPVRWSKGNWYLNITLTLWGAFNSTNKVTSINIFSFYSLAISDPIIVVNRLPDILYPNQIYVLNYSIDSIGLGSFFYLVSVQHNVTGEKMFVGVGDSEIILNTTNFSESECLYWGQRLCRTWIQGDWYLNFSILTFKNEMYTFIYPFYLDLSSLEPTIDNSGSTITESENSILNTSKTKSESNIKTTNFFGFSILFSLIIIIIFRRVKIKYR